MDKFSALTAFTTVVDEGGFAAAGRHLNLSRAQVSKLVMQLEDYFGAQLLIRTTRTVAPTPTGHAFYEQAKAILSDLASAEQSVQDSADEPRGLLRVNAPMSFGTMHLAPALSDFMARYSKLDVELTLNDRQVDPVAEGYDVTVRIGEPVDSNALIDHRVGEARRVFCAAPSYLKLRGRPKNPADLQRHDCLHYGHGRLGATWRLTGHDKTVDIPIKPRMVANNGEALLAAAVKALGIAYLPTFIVGADLQAGRLVTILEDFAGPPIDLCLIYAPNRHLSPRMRAFIDFFYERFGDRPHWDLVE